MISPVSDFVNEISSVCALNAESSVCLVLPSVSGLKVSVLLDSVCELDYEPSVCPISPNVSELVLTVTSREPGSERSIPRSETINAPHLCPGGPVTAIEITHELSSCCVIQNVFNSGSSGPPISVSEPVYELPACPVSVSEHIEELFVLPASILDAVNALPVSCVSVFPRSQFLPGFPDSPGLPWWSSGPSALAWWSSAPSAPPWCVSTPPWLPASPVPPGCPALPQFPVSPLPRGPGTLSLPLFRLRSTALLDCIEIGASGSHSWGG